MSPAKLDPNKVQGFCKTCGRLGVLKDNGHLRQHSSPRGPCPDYKAEIRHERVCSICGISLMYTFTHAGAHTAPESWELERYGQTEAEQAALRCPGSYKLAELREKR